MPLSEARLEVWSVHVSAIGRIQDVIATKTASLYSVVFAEHLLFGQWPLTFAKSLNRSVTGSVNDQVRGSKHLNPIPDLDLLEVSMRLNETHWSVLEYARPRETLVAQPRTIWSHKPAARWTFLADFSAYDLDDTFSVRFYRS
jgi:hypothetical protein